VGVLDACATMVAFEKSSHAGLVDEGMCCHASMVTDYIIPAKLEHYTCMVDLFGHSGNLQEAENMVVAMSCKLDVAS
jgi:pentatricopeptide repeat protein